MRLKRINERYFYQRCYQLTEYQLLSQYNPYYISSKISFIEQQIEGMYHLNTSHSESTIHGFVAVSYNLEKLAIWIIEQKQELERYRKKSELKIKRLKAVMTAYTPKERKEIILYMRSNGRIKPFRTIERLQEDLSKKDRNDRYKRHIKRIIKQEKERQIKVNMIKANYEMAV